MAIVESRAPVIDFELLLHPIAGNNPSGESLQYAGIYDEIREARRQDDNLEKGQWQWEAKTADYRKVISLATDALTNKTKDIQIAVWLVEALLAEHGYVGLRDGLQLVTRLQENFWVTLYPEIDEGDMEGRANAVEWLDNKTSLDVKKVPLTAGTGFTYLHWEESRGFDIPENYESLSYEEVERYKALAVQAVDENRKTGEMWRAAKSQTNRAFAEDINLLIQECENECTKLDRVIEEKFDRNQMPSVRNLKKSLEDLRVMYKAVIEEKRAAEPDPEDETPDATVEEVAEDGTVTVKTVGTATGAIQSRQDALKRLTDVADYFRKNEPHSPVSHLVQRAVKWGNMPLEGWLLDVIKDETVISQIRETLGLKPEQDESSSSGY